MAKVVGRGWLRQRGFIAAVPQGAGTAVGGVDVLHVAPPEGDDKPGDGFRPLRRDQQVDMVSHERVGMQRAAFLFKRLAQPVKVGPVIFFGEEAGLTVVSALHDVQRYAIKVDARATGHVGFLAEIIRAWPL